MYEQSTAVFDTSAKKLVGGASTSGQDLKSIHGVRGQGNGTNAGSRLWPINLAALNAEQKMHVYTMAFALRRRVKLCTSYLVKIKLKVGRPGSGQS